MGKGSARNKIKKYSKGNSPLKKVPKNSLRSKVAQTLLEGGKNIQSSSQGISCGDTAKNQTKFLPFKRKYSYVLNLKQPRNSNTCILCQKYCESQSIDCCKCKQWYHANCVHISERDLQLHQLCEIDYVCVVCIIKDIPQPNGITCIAEAVQEKCERFDLIEENVESTISSEEGELEQNNTIVDQLLLEQQQNSAASDIPCINSGEGLKETAPEGNTTPQSSVDFTPEIIVASGEPCPASENLELDNTTTVETVTQASATNNSTNLVIIDNLRESWRYKNSSNIKKEFTKYFKDIKLLLAYSLKAGGIALHLVNKDSAERILNFQWPPEAFGNSGDQLICHTASNKPKVVLKNVDTTLSESELVDIFERFTLEKLSVRRFLYRDTGKRLPVVKVTCSEAASHLLLSKSLTIRGKLVTAAKFESVHRREITCYSCREQGHIARSCPQLTTSAE